VPTTEQAPVPAPSRGIPSWLVIAVVAIATLVIATVLIARLR
jgi:hypothetical protein